MRGRPIRQAACFLAWLVAVALVFDFGVFSLPVGPWGNVALQATGYGLDVAPILLWSPGTVRTLRAKPAQIAIGVAVVLAAILYAAATRLYPHHLCADVVSYSVTGLCEELSFRGFIWDRTRRAGIGTVPLIAFNVLAFTAWHLVSVAAGQTGWSDLIGIACFATVVSVIRLHVANTGLPALLHMAVDIAGV